MIMFSLVPLDRVWMTQKKREKKWQFPQEDKNIYIQQQHGYFSSIFWWGFSPWRKTLQLRGTWFIMLYSNPAGWLSVLHLALLSQNEWDGVTADSFWHILSSQPSSGGISGINTQSAPQARALTKARYLGWSRQDKKTRRVHKQVIIV